MPYGQVMVFRSPEGKKKQVIDVNMENYYKNLLIAISISGRVIMLRIVDKKTLPTASLSSAPSSLAIMTTLAIQGMDACSIITDATSLSIFIFKSTEVRKNKRISIAGAISNLLKLTM